MRKSINILLSIFTVSFLFFSLFASAVAAATPTEVTGLRTENGKVYNLHNGKYALEVSLAPVHYKDDYKSQSEPWKDIDLTIENGQITKAPYTLSLIDGNNAIFYDKKTGDSLVFHVTDKKVDLKSLVRPNNTGFTVQLPHDTLFNFSKSKANSSIRVAEQSDSDTLLPKFQQAGYLNIDDKSKTFIEKRAQSNIEVQVGASTDDCRVLWNGSAWNFSATAAYNWVGYSSSTAYKGGAGMRFDGITIPQGVTITSAKLELRCNYSVSNTTVNSKITGEDVDDAGTFVDLADYQARRGTVVGGANDNYITTATVTWNSIPAWTSGTWYDSPDIATIVQEIVNRGSWASGNAMVMFWDDHANNSTNTAGRERDASSYNDNAAYAPKIYIEFIVPPTVTTNNATNVEETTATTGGNITDIGAANPTVRGVEYDTDSGAPYANDSHEDGSFGTGSYDRNLTGLTKGELYYYRAYATNSDGTGYGTEKTFLTKPDEPTGFTATAGDAKVDLAWTKGTGAQKTMIRYRTDGTYPTDPTNGTQAYFDTGTTYEHSGLSNGTEYLYRAWSYATEGALEQYSDLYASASATPVAWAVPSMTTGVCSGFTSKAAVLNAVMVDDGDGVVTSYGFEYGLTTGYGSTYTVTGTLPDNTPYWSNITGLHAGTVYHYRAFATNSGGTGYGADSYFSTLGSPVIYEYLNTGNDDDSPATYSSNMTAQQFTIGSISHTVTQFNLYLKKVGSPGTVTVELKHATGGLVTGNAMVSTTFNGNDLSTSYSWIPVIIDETGVEAGEEYAIVISALAGDISNYVMWAIDSGGGLADAAENYSTNGGLTWSDGAPADCLFEVWGNSSIYIYSANVYTGYRQTGDWLILADVLNIYEPYYPNEDSTLHFQLQLINGSTVVSTTTFKKWERQPLAIYLNSSTVTALDWGSAYKIRIQNLDSATVYYEYALVAGDWVEGGSYFIDSAIRKIAALLEDYYSVTLLVGTTTQTNQVLNDTGAVIFMRGIPYIQVARPSLFENAHFVGEAGSTTTTDFTPDWSTALGPRLTGFFSDLADIFDSEAEGMWGWFIIAIGMIVGLSVTGTGHGMQGISICLIAVLSGAMVFGGIPIVYVIGIASLSVILIVLWLAGVIFRQ